MRRYVALILTGSLILSLPVESVGFDDSNFELQTQNDIDRLVSESSGQTDPDPWHFNNLYDSSSKSFFIPYHLWSGADWNGKKSTENCMHRVKNTWKFVDARGRDRKTRVAGPTKLIHPVTGITYETVGVAREDLGKYLLGYYNWKRPHQANGGLAPARAEQQLKMVSGFY